MKKHISLLGLFFVSSTYATQYSGTVNVLIIDDFKHKKSKTVYQLKVNDKTYELKIPAKIDKSGLSSGVRADIEGEMNQQVLAAPEIEVKSINIKQNSLQNKNQNLIPASPRKILSLLVNFTDRRTTDTITATTLADILYNGKDSMANNYIKSSFNQLKFNPDANKDGQPDIYTVSLNYSTGTTCNSGKWGDDAVKVAKTMGINTSLYDHVMFVFPDGAACGWGGTAMLNCRGGSCYSWIMGFKPSSYAKAVYTHEIGHNLGLNHSAIDVNNDGKSENDYGDQSCFMGSNFSYYPEANAPRRDHLEWFKAYPNSLKTITTDGVYTLSPLELGADSGQLLSLKIAKRDSSQNYYISYRVNSGEFGKGDPSIVDKVSVHKGSTAGELSYFIRGLDVNQQFKDYVNKITVTVIAITGNTATVRVSFGDIVSDVINSYLFFGDDNTGSVGYSDWDPHNWKGNCAPNTETVGLSTYSTGRANKIACLSPSSSSSNASGTFVSARGGVSQDDRGYARNGDWDSGYYKWECGLNEYVSGFSQSLYDKNPLHKIRCAAGNFTNQGRNSCKAYSVRKDERGSNVGGDWDPNNAKGQCAEGQIVVGVSLDMSLLPNKILCCDK